MLKIIGLIKFNATLTEDLLFLLQQEANKTNGGNVSELLRDIITTRYKRKKLLQ